MLRLPFLLVPFVALVLARPHAAQAWRQLVDPGASGWSVERLEEARRACDAAGSAAVFVVQGGHVVVAWGAVEAPYKAASIRKSLYSLTCGLGFDRGCLDLDATLGDLGIDDLEPLSEVEKGARVVDLMAARSGVYHPSAYETESNAERHPARGSARPGERWNYNNWDFNLVPELFALQCEKPLAQVFVEELARPLGVEDLVPERHLFTWLEPSLSRHPALLIRLSARDLARFGELVLRGGVWGERRLLSEEWLALSTEPVTVFEPGSERGGGNGYGLLWWTLPADPNAASEGRRHARIQAQGSGGQLLVVVRDLDLVLVHRTDTDRTRGMSETRAEELLESIVAARVGPPAAAPELRALAPTPLSGGRALASRDREPVPAATIATVAGDWKEESGDGRLTLFEHEGRLFARRDQGRVQEAELFLSPGDGHLFSTEAPLEVEILEREGDSAVALALTLFGRRSVGHRVDPSGGGGH